MGNSTSFNNTKSQMPLYFNPTNHKTTKMINIPSLIVKLIQKMMEVIILTSKVYLKICIIIHKYHLHSNNLTLITLYLTCPNSPSLTTCFRYNSSIICFKIQIINMSIMQISYIQQMIIK